MEVGGNTQKFLLKPGCQNNLVNVVV